MSNTFDPTKETLEAPDEKSFWDKMKSGARKMGGSLACTGIEAYLAMSDKATPYKDKIVLGSALAYLVLPADMIPDIVPVAGYTDDAAALGIAVKTASDSITEKHEEEAQQIWDDL
ncbi:DUF1232 domain-containing protein [Photobacterium makurazakiensis]|uniref:YkvA family protein n=1 Tax=Photobacterium TaxID=657 RepID=UPI003D0990C5